jgi:3-oxoacyl-(acyl-carrier-protein) synthase
VSALGSDVAACVRGLREGRVPAAPASERSRHLAPTPGDPLPVREVPLDPGDPWRRARDVVDRAVDEAWGMARATAGAGETVGVFAGTTGGFFVDGEYALRAARDRNPAAWPPFVQRGPGELAAHVATRLGATGPLATFSTACTSSAMAVVAAHRHLRVGSCDRAVVVGFDVLSSLTLHGFRSLLLVDGAACRPFDVDRNGLQLGEGAGVVVLAAEPDVGPYRVEGSANRTSAGHLTSADTDGAVAEQVIRAALDAASRDPAEVVSINAHGTGTRDNDQAEGLGIRRVFGDAPPPFASLKGAVGHTLGAAGALEIALWLGALQAGFRPASTGFSTVDPEIGIAPEASIGPAVRGVHVFNGFGFGGSCVSTVITDASHG